MQSEGDTNVSLAATGAAGDPALATDVRAAQDSINGKVNGYPWWPVVGMGLMYRF